MLARTIWLIFGLGMLVSAAGATVGSQSLRLPFDKDQVCTARVAGEIDQSTPRQLALYLMEHPACKGHQWNVYFDSPGGDVDAAISLGKMLRKANANTRVGSNDSCASACVFAYVGGVQRLAVGRIGLHRPFPIATPDSSAAMRHERMAIDKKLSAYLKEMAIPVSLLDNMNQISPADIKWLDPNIDADFNVLRGYHLEGVDVAYEDYEDADFAKKLGISMEELYHRENKANSECNIPGRNQVQVQACYIHIVDDCRDIEIIDGKATCGDKASDKNP